MFHMDKRNVFIHPVAKKITQPLLEYKFNAYSDLHSLTEYQSAVIKEVFNSLEFKMIVAALYYSELMMTANVFYKRGNNSLNQILDQSIYYYQTSMSYSDSNTKIFLTLLKDFFILRCMENSNEDLIKREILKFIENEPKLNQFSEERPGYIQYEAPFQVTSWLNQSTFYNNSRLGKAINILTDYGHTQEKKDNVIPTKSYTYDDSDNNGITNYIVAALLIVGGIFNIKLYLFYIALRLICTLVFGYQAIMNWENKKWASAIFAVGVIIFNPIIPLYLGKATWQIVDIVFAVIILVVPRIK